MKIIHCADIHLDAPMTGFHDPKKAEERRNELLLTFVRMVRYAAKNDVRLILIAGDLFDGERIRASTLDIVLQCITGNPKIDFLYTTGNHEKDAFIRSLRGVPENLKLFTGGKKIYRYEEEGMRIAVSSPVSPEELELDPADLNLVLWHGEIQLPRWKNRNIDYLALGHYHSMQEGSLGYRGRYCYSGCLEGRGFDESGEKGFIRLDLTDGVIDPVFIKAARRVIHEVPVDVTGAQDTPELDRRIGQALKEEGAPEIDLVKVVLEGKTSPEADLNLTYLAEKYSGDYYAFRLTDRNVEPEIPAASPGRDISLRGEFIRLVSAAQYSDEEKSAVIRAGIAALEGRRIEAL